LATTSDTTARRVAQASKRIGYMIAAAVNLFMLYVVNNLDNWDVLPWLTDDFGRVLPWINASLIAGIVANVWYIGDNRKTIRAGGEMVTTAIGLVATVRVLNVFPFDFSAYEFSWGFVARTVLVIAIVGSLVGIVVQAFKLARATADDG
jgi:hypothetical protein